MREKQTFHFESGSPQTLMGWVTGSADPDRQSPRSVQAKNIKESPSQTKIKFECKAE